jgi:hypothetical protein
MAHRKNHPHSQALTALPACRGSSSGCLLVLVLLLFPRRDKNPTARSTATDKPAAATNEAASSARARPFNQRPNSRSSVGTAATAEEIVTNKVAQFARSRRQLAHAMAEHFKKPVPDEFERFFDAAEAGRYDEMTAIYKALRKQRETEPVTWYGPHWRTIVETQGVADAAHQWPAQKLLDYGPGRAWLASSRHGVCGRHRSGLFYSDVAQ